MCDLDRSVFSSLSVLEKARSIHRLPDATPLEIEFAEYIVAHTKSRMLEAFKDFNQQIGEQAEVAQMLAINAQSVLNDLRHISTDMKAVIKELS